jgi:hypothetical protein
MEYILNKFFKCLQENNFESITVEMALKNHIPNFLKQEEINETESYNHECNDFRIKYGLLQCKYCGKLHKKLNA